jgi:hypothetical protein
MMDYSSQLRGFVKAITCGEMDTLMALIKDVRAPEINRAQRIAIYRDGYEERLCSALRADYPALEHYIGPAAFERAAATYIGQTPSRHWDLNLYPIGFAGFFQVWSEQPSAVALAHLESAIAEVFWLPDSPPLDPNRLARLSLDALAQYRFSPRYALKLLALTHAANDYLTAFRKGLPLQNIKQNHTFLCVYRHRNEVHRLSLRPEEYVMLSLLSQGLPFGDALQRAGANGVQITQDRLMELMANWLKRGFFANTDPSQSNAS